MAGDIVPIEIGLTDGDLVTLWAPRWREGDDEWEAFLGHEEDLYGFSSVAELAAFIRTDSDNDLVERPLNGPPKVIQPGLGRACLLPRPARPLAPDERDAVGRQLPALGDAPAGRRVGVRA